MNVLWIAYQPLPAILHEISPETQIATGGWLQGAADIICRHKDICLTYCFQGKKQCQGTVDGIAYYSICEAEVVRSRDILKYREKDYIRFKQIIDSCNPDVIQIFGTETWFQRQFVFMLDKMNLLDRTVVWIQGLAGFCAQNFSNGITQKMARRKTLWELLRGTNISGIKKRLEINGISEKKAVKKIKNVFVRTDWDQACCKAFNPSLNFYFCNETLRPGFYEDDIWGLNKIEPHSIFMSQYGTPIKGYHQMLRAMPIILQEFPDAILYCTGKDLLKGDNSCMEKLREPSYLRMLREEICSHSLENNVRFLGVLQEKDMRNQYLKSHVFVSASVIENSPNSIAEAMILGVPIVASDVGGVSSMLTHKEDGYLYPFDEYALLAEYICRIFRDDSVACEFSEKGREKALKRHDQEKNYGDLLDAYRTIIGCCQEE